MMRSSIVTILVCHISKLHGARVGSHNMVIMHIVCLG